MAIIGANQADVDAEQHPGREDADGDGDGFEGRVHDREEDLCGDGCGGGRPALSPAPVPTITGTAKVGSVLTAVPGTWGPAPVAFTYQWNASGVAIVGANQSTLTPTAPGSGRR